MVLVFNFYVYNFFFEQKTRLARNRLHELDCKSYNMVRMVEYLRHLGGYIEIQIKNGAALRGTHGPSGEAWAFATQLNGIGVQS